MCFITDRGLHTGINGYRIGNIIDLQNYIEKEMDAHKQHVFTLIRNQKKMEIIIDKLLLPVAKLKLE